MLGKLPVPGRSTYLDYSRARACCACNRCTWGLFGHFSLNCHFSFLSHSPWETARYRLKYCLKRPLNPEQPTNQFNPAALRMAKTLLSFGHSECKMVKQRLKTLSPSTDTDKGRNSFTIFTIKLGKMAHLQYLQSLSSILDSLIFTMKYCIKRVHHISSVIRQFIPSKPIPKILICLIRQI